MIDIRASDFSKEPILVVRNVPPYGLKTIPPSEWPRAIPGSRRGNDSRRGARGDQAEEEKMEAEADAETTMKLTKIRILGLLRWLKGLNAINDFDFQHRQIHAKHRLIC